MSDMSKIFLGIDVAKNSFVASYLHCDKYYTESFDNNKSGFNKLLSWIDYKKYDVVCCMESTGVYSYNLANFLYNKKVFVCLENPLKIHAYAKSRLTRHKNDEVDSRVICEYASKAELRAYKPLTNEHKKLKDISKAIDKYKSDITRFKNQFEAKDSTDKKIMSSYKRMIKHIEKEIELLEKEFLKIITSNESLELDYNNLQTIPGISKITSQVMIGFIYDCSRFKTAKELSAYLGLIPSQYSSGSSIRKQSRVSKIGCSRIRKSLYFPAISAMIHNPIVKEFSEKLKSKGKSNMCVIVACMHKLVHIIFGILKHKKPFDANILKEQKVNLSGAVSQ